MNNPINFINSIKSIKDPKQAVLTLVGPNIPPVVQNLVEMAENGQIEDLKTFGRNMFKERGMDFDKEYNDFVNKIRNGDIF